MTLKENCHNPTLTSTRHLEHLLEEVRQNRKGTDKDIRKGQNNEWREKVEKWVPKQSGEGTRPVTVFRSLFRWYGKLLAKEAAVWAANTAGHEVNNRKGRETLDATYREQARAEARKRLGIISVEVGKDVQKAFEQVSRWILVREGTERKYPRRALWMSLMAYTWKRRMCLQGVLGRPVGSNIGIVAGSPFAVQELTVIMCKVIEHWSKANPSGCISIHVDDIAISTWARSVEEVRDRILKGVQSLDEVVEDHLEMKIF